ncbi:MAG: penicillin-binding protein 2 [Lentisphaerae bacterium]|jgi:penicillin-binding protein 2|nr:penicillin-binding protein 2 [Lentisphaerota bacterium]
MKSSTTDENRFLRLRLERRVLLCVLLLVLPILLLLIRLWQVQVVQGPELSRHANRQSARRMRVSPVRGRMFSRDGALLVGNNSCYDVVFHLSEMRQGGALSKTVEYVMRCANRLSSLFGRPHELVEKRLRDRLVSRASEPVVVFRGLNAVELAQLSELVADLPGVAVHIRNERSYEHPGLASHLLGTTGWRVPTDGRGSEEYMQSFALEELVGTSGLESVYEKDLGGKGGEQLLQVDYRGYYHGVLSSTPAQDGYDLKLTLDLKAQAIAEKLLVGHHGAFVVIEVETGAILVLASSPTFDLSTLTKERYGELATDKVGMPLFNRAVDGKYTPGSILKPLVALAALEHGAIDPSWRFECQGRYRFGDAKIDCSGRAVHGVIDIVEAITMSCNGFFVDAGLKTGVDNMEAIFKTAGIGAPTEIDFYEHGYGVFPSRDGMYRRSRRHWGMADTAFLSIGQGEISMSPLQAVMFCGALANGGRLMRPYLVGEVIDGSGRVVRRSVPEVRQRLAASEENLSIVRSGMESAVMMVRGSARVMRESGMAVAAKTGTAEVDSADGKHKNTWIIAYGPVSSPEIALVCLIERGQSGGKTAGPIAAEFLHEWKSE